MRFQGKATAETPRSTVPPGLGGRPSSGVSPRPPASFRAAHWFPSPAFAFVRSLALRERDALISDPSPPLAEGWSGRHPTACCSLRAAGSVSTSRTSGLQSKQSPSASRCCLSRGLLWWRFDEPLAPSFPMQAEPGVVSHRPRGCCLLGPFHRAGGALAVFLYFSRSFTLVTCCTVRLCSTEGFFFS